MNRLHLGQWVWAEGGKQPALLVDVQPLWGQETCRIWLPDRDVVVRVHEDELLPLDVGGVLSPAHIDYITAAARAAEALTQDVLLAPIGSSVIPLPHQIRALSRALR